GPAPPRRHPEQAVVDAGALRLLVQPHAGCQRLPPQRADELRRVHRGTVAVEDATPERGRGASARKLCPRQGKRLLPDAELVRNGDGAVENRVLRRRRGDPQQSAYAKPDVLLESA